jgi:hypothetical protein
VLIVVLIKYLACFLCFLLFWSGHTRGCCRFLILDMSSYWFLVRLCIIIYWLLKWLLVSLNSKWILLCFSCYILFQIIFKSWLCNLPLAVNK